MMDKRFTLDGSDELERHLDGTCRLILAEVQAVIPRRKFLALVLGGGYGRGEGGVLHTAHGDRPYNDLEFYVFVSGNRLWNERMYGSALCSLAKRLSPEAGLHLEFKIDSLGQMRRNPISLFTYDLIAGHRALLGENVFNGCEHHLQAGSIPVSEASRLLFNRCTGLLLVRELLHESSRSGSHTSASPDEADFMGRNLAKAQLCLGDALLVALGQYHWSCRERERRLASLAPLEEAPWFEQVRAQHREGVRFKLHPRQIWKSVLEFELEHRQLSALCLKIWLWLENRRLGCNFSSVRDYAFHRRAKCPEAARWRNYLLNLRIFGAKAALAPVSWRYPRERLLNALALLLWNGEASQAPEITRHLQKQLSTSAVDWPGFVATYKQIWPKYG